MQQFALMVNNREPAISDVIGFMDGVSFKSGVQVNVSLRTLSTADMTVILQSTMCLLMVQMEMFFSAHLIILGVGQTVH